MGELENRILTRLRVRHGQGNTADRTVFHNVPRNFEFHFGPGILNFTYCALYSLYSCYCCKVQVRRRGVLLASKQSIPPIALRSHLSVCERFEPIVFRPGVLNA